MKVKYRYYAGPPIITWLVGTIIYGLTADKSGGMALLFVLGQLLILAGIGGFLVQTLRYFMHRRRARGSKEQSNER